MWATDIYKFKYNLGPEIPNTRNDSTRDVKSVSNGNETVTYRAQNTWNMIPDDIKNT